MKLLKKILKLFKPISEKRAIEWILMYESRILMTQAKLEYVKSLIERNIIDEKYLKEDINNFKLEMNNFREIFEPRMNKIQKDYPDEYSRLKSVLPIYFKQIGDYEG